MTGTIKSVLVDRGFGFIRRAAGEKGDDIFFHCKSLDTQLLFDESLTEMRVLYDLTTDERSGRPRAVNVRPAP